MKLDPSRLRSGSLLVPTAEEWAAIDRRAPRAQAWKGSEHELQKHLISRAALYAGSFPELARLYAVPNGGHRSKAAAGKLRAEGQRPGVPDLVLPVACGGRPGLYLELKRQDGRPTPDQVDWLTFLHRQGYAAHVANDPATAWSLILSYLEP